MATKETPYQKPDDRKCGPCRPGWNHAAQRHTCPDCLVTWQRTILGWIMLNMECPCGARASSEWVWTEWGSDTECGECYRERRAEARMNTT